MRVQTAAFAIVLSVLLSFPMQADADVRHESGPRRDVIERPDPDLVKLYFSLGDLSLEDQRHQMWALSSKTKAALWTYNITRYLGDHPELSANSQEILREGIRLVSMPAWFEIVPGAFGYEQKSNALAQFKLLLQTLPPQTVNEVFIRLGPEPEPVTSDTRTPVPSEPPNKSRLVPRVDQRVCYCAGSWECLSSASFHCYPSWCEMTIHCGVFNNEICTGTCKEEDPL